MPDGVGQGVYCGFPPKYAGLYVYGLSILCLELEVALGVTVGVGLGVLLGLAESVGICLLKPPNILLIVDSLLPG